MSREHHAGCIPSRVMSPWLSSALGLHRMSYWDSGHPFRWRTWLRAHLPWFLINVGIADKGQDCEGVGGEHWWYNKDGEHSACYHCKVEREGRLWREKD
jgi:hypothetical protein